MILPYVNNISFKIILINLNFLYDTLYYIANEFINVVIKN